MLQCFYLIFDVINRDLDFLLQQKIYSRTPVTTVITLLYTQLYLVHTLPAQLIDTIIHYQSPQTLMLHLNTQLWEECLLLGFPSFYSNWRELLFIDITVVGSSCAPLLTLCRRDFTLSLTDTQKSSRENVCNQKDRHQHDFSSCCHWPVQVHGYFVLLHLVY